jgi:hypothetical protein
VFARSIFHVLTVIESKRQPPNGEMAEWLKAHAWKACILERVSRVRIPVSPPLML